MVNLENRKPVVADMHNDLPIYVLKFRRQGMHRVIENRYLEHMKAGDVNLIVCAVFLSDSCAPDWYNEAMAQVKALKEDIAESADKLKLCTSLAEVDEAHADGKIALLLSMEGGEPLRTVEDLETFYQEGVRFLGLTWSRENALADGCSFLPITQPEEKKGLKPFGKEILNKASELGMIIDMSHISEAAFWQILEHTDGPVYASHSNTQAVRGIYRNLSDKQLLALKERGGIVGLNGVEDIVCPRGEDMKKGFTEHVCHLREVMGSDQVGLGLDLYAYYQDQREGKASDTFRSYAELPMLDEWLDGKIAPDDMEKIKGENFYSFLKRACF